MKSDKLYRVQREDLPKLEQLLYRCFAHDPLYETLIPDAEIRKRLMPELFQCDMDEFYETCEIFADSEELNSILVVSDEAEHINMFHFFLTVMGDDPYGRFPDQGRSDTCDVPQFYQGWGLPELKLDRSAAPDTETSYYLSCSRSGNAAPWDRCETVR